METAKLPQATENVGNIRSKDATIFVALVDRDKTKVLEETSPMALMMLHDSQVEHVRIGQHDLDVPADPRPVLTGRGAVISTYDRSFVGQKS